MISALVMPQDKISEEKLWNHYVSMGYQHLNGLRVQQLIQILGS